MFRAGLMPVHILTVSLMRRHDLLASLIISSRETGRAQMPKKPRNGLNEPSTFGDGLRQGVRL